MIPKIIHYCWFGRGPLPDLAQKCIASWQKYMPDYKIKEWNEDNFDVNSIPYTKEAYKSRKYAFVSDVVRLYALYYEGGIYMDTDVEILKPLDDLLTLSAFTSYESGNHMSPVTGLIASKAHGEWVKEQLDAYNELHFLKEDGTMDLTTNTRRISSIMKANGFEQDGRYHQYKDLHVFTSDYFCPMDSLTGKMRITDHTYSIHWFSNSWSDISSFRQKLSRLSHRIFGVQFTSRIHNMLKKK